MKKFIAISMVLSFVTIVFAQSGKDSKIKVDYYGIDFSVVNVVGANEPESKFIDVFHRINYLLITEQNKYDPSKYISLDIQSTNVDPAIKQLEKLKETKFTNRQSSEISYQEVINAYPATDSYGLVFVAVELNKYLNKGTFMAVIFDNNKQIVAQDQLSGKSGGFGLRNFWAGAFHGALQDAMYRKDFLQGNVQQ